MAKVIKSAVIAAAAVFVTIAIIASGGTMAPLFTSGALAFGGSTAAFAIAAQYAVVTLVGAVVAGGIGMLTSRGISASRQNFGTKIAGRGAQVPRQIVYGECRVGGTIVKMHTSGTKNNKLHLAVVLAGHEIESLVGVYLNDNLLTTTTTTVGGETVYRVTNSKYKNTDNEHEIDTNGTLIQYTFHDGSQTTVDGLASTNAASRYPSTAKFQGMAYVYMEIIYDPEKMPGMPPLSFRVKGKKVYDPRTSTTAYSNNPALIIRDYLTDTTYGLRALSSEINDTTAGGGFAAAANACEADVTLADNSSTEKRFTLNGFVNAASAGDAILEGFISSCGGKLTHTNGKFNLFVATAQTPTLSINDDDVLDTQQLSTKSGNGDLFNGIKALYVDKEQNYQGAESPLLVDSTYLAEDTPSGEQSANYKKILETQLPFTVTHTMAQRLQKIQLKRHRESATLSLLTTLEFMKLQPGDWVNVTNARLSYSDKTFEVLSTQMEFAENEGVVYAATRLTLQEVSAGIYDYVYSEYSTPQTAGSTPPGGDLSVGAPTAVSLAQRTRPEGPTAKIDIIASWTNAAETGVQGTEIQYKESGESAYDVATIAGRGATSAVIQNVQVGKTYDVRIRHFSWDNVYGSFVSFSQLTITEPDTLLAPGNPSATTDKPFFIELTWTNPTNANFRAVEVHYSTTSGFTPDSNTLLNTYYGEPAKQKKVILGVSAGLLYDTNYYFKLRSVNVYGTTSGYTNQATGQFKKAQNADVENLNASAITAGTIDASTVTVSNIDAGNITTGTLDSSRVNAGEIVVGGLESGVTIDSGSLTMSAGGHIKGGQTGYNDTSNSGFFLGYDTDAYKFSIGADADNSLTFDGTALTISGEITASSGTIGGFTLGATSLLAGADATTVSLSTADGIHLGATAFSSAPFKVTRAGALTATNATISGAITASSLNIESATVTGTLSADNIEIDGVTLDTNESGQLIIADGGVGNAQLGSGSVSLSNIIEGSVSKVNPVTQTGNIYRWAGYDDAGNVVNAVPSGITVEYDSTERALELRNDGNVGMRSDTFVIDQNSIYKITFKVKKDSAVGNWYIGAYQLTSATTGLVIDGGNVQSSQAFTIYNYSTRASSSDANAYFWNASGTTSYVSFVCYLIGANVDIDEVPSQTTNIIQAADGYDHVGLRILNWSNSGTTTSLFVKDLSVVEMTATTIIADNISTTNLAAINSDLGAITAGSLNINNAFTVSSAGVMTATGADVSGAITATSLTLSGTSIASSQLAQGVQDSLGLADSAVQDGDTGVNLGIDDGSVAGINIDSTKLYAGTGTWANSNTGFYLDNTGQFSLKDKLFFNPTNNTLTVDGNITADVITAKENLIVLGDLEASSMAAGSITRAMFSQDALDEIFGSLATAVGGSNGDYKSGSGSFTTSGGSVELGTSSDKFDHGTASVYLEFNINAYFYATTDYSTASQRQATLTFEATADGTYTDLTSATKTQVIEFGRYDLSSYYGSTYLVYYLNNSFIKILTTGTGNDLPDTTDLQFRVSVSSVGTAFTGQTIAFDFEANEGVTGVTSTGGNADTLDNLDSTKFLRSDVDDTFDGTLTITGNLILQGGIDQYNVTNLDVTDKTITVNNGGTQTLSDGAGLIVDRGTAADASILWDETNDEFDISNTVKVAGSLGVTNIVTNKVVKFDGTVLNDSNITDTGSAITLGSATTITGNLTINSNANINLSGDLKMTGTDSYIWTPNTTDGFTGFWDPNNNQIAARYNNDDGGWGILGEPESGTELKVHGKIKATDFQVFKELAAGGGSYETYHWNQVHAAISVHSASNTYVILNTAVPQDNYSMGGFTLICFNEYDDASEGDVIHIYGYWNPESNGGFTGFRYVCSNPDFEPTIQVGRNSSGNTAFLISGFDDTRYTVMVARDLYLGYSADNAAASWGDGWAFSQASATTGYSYLNTLTRVGITDTQVANWNTAYTYSQVGHLPLSGGTISGSLTAGNTIVGDQSDISMDASANGQLEIRGNGYTGAIALNGNDMHIYQNSATRGLVLGTDETARLRVEGGGDVSVYQSHNVYSASRWYVSQSDSAHQRADARDESTNWSRLHWYGVNDSGGTSNFRHAWYDGSSYVNVTATGASLSFDSGSSARHVNIGGSATTTSNPSGLLLQGRNSSSQTFNLEIMNRGNHSSASFRNKIDFSVNNNGTYYYSALRFGQYGDLETKQVIADAAAPYATTDRYFKLTNDAGSASGTLVTANNGNTWLNADGGKDLWLNWYSLNNSTSHADLQVGDGDGGGAILTVVGVDRRVGILDNTPSYPLDVAGDIRGTGTVRADSGINVHSGKISTTSSNQTGGGNVETYYQPDGNNNHTWRLIAGGTNTGYGTGAGGLGFFYQSSGGGNPDYNLILRANQTSRFGGRVDIEHDNIGAEPYSGLIVKNTATSGDRLGGITIDAPLQTHYRYMLGGVTKWQTRVGAGGATDDWRLYSFTTSSDILTVKPSGEGQLRLFKTANSTQWTETSGVGSISISGYEGQSSGSNPTIAFSAGGGGYAMFYLNRIISGSEAFSDSSARYFDFYRAGASKARMVMSASDEFGFYMNGSGSFNVWNSGGTNTVSVGNNGTTTLYALNVSNSAQVGGSNIFHAGYSNTWAQIPSGTRTDYNLKFKPAVNNFAGFDFRDPDNNNAGYLLIRGTSDVSPTYTANGITLVCDTGDVSIVQRTTTNKAIRFLTNNTTNFAERGRFAASGNFLVGTTAEGGLNNSEGSIRAAGKIDTSAGANGAFRFYDGTTFRGGFGTYHWATGTASANNLAILGNTNGGLYVFTNNDASTPKFAVGADGVLYPYSTRWDRTYHQVDAYASGGSANDVHTHWGVLCAGSHNGTPSAYTIIETNIDQDAYRMGGFTILVMDKYNDHKTRARIDLAGYWNPESNGGFIGWGYTTTNTRERPTIYVMRNSSTGKVAFAYQHSAVVGASYPVILACDLWIGYSASAEADGKNWSIKQQADLTGYTNTDQVNHVGGNGNYQNNDGSFVISKSSGAMFSHGSYSDAIGYNGDYGTYIGANGRYVYSGLTTHPIFYDGSTAQAIHHNGGQIFNTYAGDHTFSVGNTSAGGIVIQGSSTGGPKLSIKSTNTGGKDWWLISNNSGNADGVGYLQFWNNTNGVTAATWSYASDTRSNIYTPLKVEAKATAPVFTSTTSGDVRPLLSLDVSGQAAHGLLVNQTNPGYWAQIISTQRYGLNIDSHASDSGTYLLNTSIAGVDQFTVLGDGTVRHRTTTQHGVQGSVAGNAYYYADGSNGANIDYYSPNGAQAHMDCRNDGNHSKLHKYTYVAAYGYGSYKEAWWDGNSYHEIGSISDAIRTNGDFVASGNVTAYGSYSDRRLKENIRPFENARELIKDIDVHRFNYIGKDDDLIGVIAQEVEETLPQLVYELIDTDSNEVRKAVRYDHLSAVLLKVVKEQEHEIQELKALVHSLLEKIK